MKRFALHVVVLPHPRSLQRAHTACVTTPTQCRRHGRTESRLHHYDLGTLGGTFRPGAATLTRADSVVGSSTTASGDEHAFVWTPQGGMKDLSTLGGTFSLAWSVNDAGQVVGSSTNRRRATSTPSLVFLGRNEGPWHSRRSLQRGHGHQ